MSFSTDTPLIGLCGGIGCGKTSVAEILVKEYDFRELSFADKLKKSAMGLFQIPKASCYGTQAEKLAPIPHLGEVASTFAELGGVWPDRVGQPWSGRFLLEFFGTEACRKVWPPIWVEAVAKIIQRDRETSLMRRHVVADVRFQNEADMIHRLGGIIGRIEVEGAEHEKTGHASDTWYQDARVEFVITAPKPGLATLCRKTDALMETLGVTMRQL